jgi:hypothetical protein
VSTITCRELKAKISDALKENFFVVYGDCVVYNDTSELRTPGASNKMAAKSHASMVSEDRFFKYFLLP